MSTALDALLRHDPVRWQQIRAGDHERREAEDRMFSAPEPHLDVIQRLAATIALRATLREAVQ